MATPTVTYTFANSTPADATEVNQNFTDILDALTDGAADLVIGTLQVTAATTFNGTVTLGNATGDDITFTGRVASDIDPKFGDTYDLGDATQTWRALYLDNDTTDGGAIYFDAGSTEYIRSSADGATLEIGGFTAFDFPGGGADENTLGLVKKPKTLRYTDTTGQAGLTNGVEYSVICDSQENSTFTGGEYNSVTGEFTVAENGIYLFNGNAQIQGTTADTIVDAYLYISKNGGAPGNRELASRMGPGTTNKLNIWAGGIDGVLPLVAGDVIRLRAQANTSGPSWLIAGNVWTYLCITKIG